MLASYDLSTESVKSSALSLESVDDVESSDSLSLGVLGVGDGITDDVLEEDLQDGAGLLVDEAGDALHATTTSETADGGLGDALDIVAKHLAVTLGASLAESFTSFTTSRHVDFSKLNSRMISLPQKLPLYTKAGDAIRTADPIFQSKSGCQSVQIFDPLF